MTPSSSIFYYFYLAKESVTKMLHNRFSVTDSAAFTYPQTLTFLTRKMP
jgi:hypothetical protein